MNSLNASVDFDQVAECWAASSDLTSNPMRLPGLWIPMNGLSEEKCL